MHLPVLRGRHLALGLVGGDADIDGESQFVTDAVLQLVSNLKRTAMEHLVFIARRTSVRVNGYGFPHLECKDRSSCEMSSGIRGELFSHYRIFQSPIEWEVEMRWLLRTSGSYGSTRAQPVRHLTGSLKTE